MNMQVKSYSLRWKTYLLLLVGITQSLFAQDSQNLLLNGSFEIDGPPGGFKTLREGDMILGWEVMRGTVDLTGTYFKSFDGDYSMDMNGTPGTGAIEQRFFTEKGKKYLLSFYLSGNCAGGPKIKRVMVFIGDEKQLFEFDTEGRSNQDMGWTKCEMVFKAIDRKTTLRFESPPDYEPSNYGAAIDMVSVVKTSRSKGSTGGSKTIAKDEPRKEKGGFFGAQYGLLAGGGYYFAGKNTPELLSYDATRYNLEATRGGAGFHLGGYAAVFAGPVFLRPEFRITSHQVTYGLVGNSQTGKEHYQQVEIPLLLGFQVNSLKFFAGPTGHLYLFRISRMDDLGSFDSAARTFTFSYELGAGIDLSFLELDLRFGGNLSRFGDGVLINDSTKLYTTDMPDRLLLTVSIPLN
jgi:choice-of-anchor C domain-containing protein